MSTTGTKHICTLKGLKALVALLVPFVLCGVVASAHATDSGESGQCNSVGDVEFICGLGNVEDMVQVPGRSWIIGAGSHFSMYVINTETREWYPMEITTLSQAGSTEFDGCSVAWPAAGDYTHGIALRTEPGGAHELYVVNHGTRESVEVFDVDLSADVPAIVWKDCILMPENSAGNAVAPLPGGGIAVTVSLDGNDPESFEKMMAGELSGFVLEWLPESGWRRMEGSELSANNGIESTPDGKLLYVAAFGTGEVVRMSRGASGAITHKAVVQTPFDLIDNVRWSPQGTLMATGHNGTVEEGVDCLRFETVCSQDYGFVEIDPDDLRILKVVNKEGTSEFGSASTVLQVADEYWLGTFRGNRVGILTAD